MFLFAPAIASMPAQAEAEAEGEAEADDSGAPVLLAEGWFASWLHGDRLVGDLLGAGPFLRKYGIGLECSYVHDVYQALGGADEGFRQSRFLDLNLTVDLDEAVGWQGATFFVDTYHVSGSGVGAKVGDIQGVSNIEAERDNILASLWLEQYLFDDTLRLKVGKLDANNEFAFAENASDFLNSSMGFSPTIFVLPTFPDPAYAVVAELFATEESSLRVGVHDGAGAEGIRTGRRGPESFLGDPADLFLIGQVGTSWQEGVLGRPGRLGVGTWQHTGRFERFRGGTKRQTRGYFLVLEQSVAVVDVSEVQGYLQAGTADESVSVIRTHLGAGAVWSGFAGGRERAGFGATWVEFSRVAGFDDPYELALELFTAFPVTPWLAIQPDIQYVIQPGGTRRNENALVLGLRLTVLGL